MQYSMNHELSIVIQGSGDSTGLKETLAIWRRWSYDTLCNIQLLEQLQAMHIINMSNSGGRQPKGYDCTAVRLAWANPHGLGPKRNHGHVGLKEYGR